MYESIPKLISKTETVGHIGKIENVVGMSMEASGGRSSIGDIVMIYNEEQNQQMPAEVVGFKEGKIQLMTYDPPAASPPEVLCGIQSTGSRFRWENFCGGVLSMPWESRSTGRGSLPLRSFTR